MSRPSGVLRIGDGAAISLSPRDLDVIARGLAALHEQKIERTEEAVQDGNLDHADRRARARRVIENLIDFLVTAGVRRPHEYWQDKSLPLPSERSQSSETAEGTEP